MELLLFLFFFKLYLHCSLTLAVTAAVSSNLLAAPFSSWFTCLQYCASVSFSGVFRELNEEFLTAGGPGASFINSLCAQFCIQNVIYQFLLACAHKFRSTPAHVYAETPPYRTHEGPLAVYVLKRRHCTMTRFFHHQLKLKSWSAALRFSFSLLLQL